MTENTPTPTPNTKSNVKRNVLIFGAVTLAGVTAFAAIALGVQSPQNPVTAPSHSASQTQEAKETADSDLYPKYLADSIAKLSTDGGLFMSSDVSASEEPATNFFYRIYNPDAGIGNLSSTIQTADSANLSTLSSTTPSQLFAQGALADGSIINLTTSASDIKQTGPNTFTNTTGAREAYEVANGLIVRISTSGSEGPMDIQISYGLDANLLEIFTTETQVEDIQ